MIPVFNMLLRTTGTSSPPAAALVLTFPGGATAASMGTGDSIVLTYDWNGGAETADLVSFQVYKVGNAPTQWAQDSFTATATRSSSDTFSSADSGWDGAGTYQFYAIATLGGPPVAFSSEITLTVT